MEGRNVEMNSVATSQTQSTTDAEFQAELRTDCIKTSPQQIEATQRLLQAFAKNASDPKQLHDLYRSVHSVTGNTGLAGLSTISKVAAALEALLREVQEKPDLVSVSVLRTVAQSLDCLRTLFQYADKL